MPADQVADFKRGRTACAVGEKIAKQYNIKPGDRVVIVGDIYPVTLELTDANLIQGQLRSLTFDAVELALPSREVRRRVAPEDRCPAEAHCQS